MRYRNSLRIIRGTMLFMAGITVGVLWRGRDLQHLSEIPGLSSEPQIALAPEVPETVDGESEPQAVDWSTRGRINEFQGDEIGLVLRTLARQAKINMVISDRVTTGGGTVTARLENKTAREAIDAIVKSKGLVAEDVDGVLYVKAPEEVRR
jgi:hypothetical protein